MEIALRIPIKPHLRKYIAATHDVEPTYQLSTWDFLGMAVWNVLTRDARGGSADQKKYSHVLVVTLSPYYYEEYMHQISDKAVTRFNETIDRMLKDEMVRHVRKERLNGKMIKEGLESFLAFYEFTEDELAYETIKKRYDREERRRNSKKLQKNYDKNVLSF